MTLAGMVGALSLKRQQHPIAALQAQALDLSQHAQQAPVHSHFRPCWGQRGAAIGLPMLPHVGQVAVEVRTEKLSRSVAAASVARMCPLCHIALRVAPISNLEDVVHAKGGV